MGGRTQRKGEWKGRDWRKESNLEWENEKVVVVELEEGIRFKGEWDGGGGGSLVKV